MKLPTKKWAAKDLGGIAVSFFLPPFFFVEFAVWGRRLTGQNLMIVKHSSQRTRAALQRWRICDWVGLTMTTANVRSWTIACNQLFGSVAGCGRSPGARRNLLPLELLAHKKERLPRRGDVRNQNSEMSAGRCLISPSFIKAFHMPKPHSEKRKFRMRGCDAKASDLHRNGVPHRHRSKDTTHFIPLLLRFFLMRCRCSNLQRC